MDKKISTETRKELIEVLGNRYRKSLRMEKAQILDEFIAVSGYHRKHAVRLLNSRTNNSSEQSNSDKVAYNRRIYDEAVKEALIITWEATYRIRGKRLKVILPDIVDAMERYCHLKLDMAVRNQMLKVSAATIDRLLSPMRNRTQSRKRSHSRPKVSKQVPIRTFADWGQPNPGHLEIDLVAHRGQSMSGSYIHTLVATDISCGWTEFMPLLAREQSLVVEGLKILRRQIPFPVLGIDSDNDSTFINDTLLTFCKEHHMEFTRSRAYHKNDQAWVEQKNGTIIRRMAGYVRFAGIIACQALAHLYHAARLYVNYFQQSFNLSNKRRDGAKVKYPYDRPATPCERLLNHPSIDDATKVKLRSERQQLDPVELLHHIRQSQVALSALASADSYGFIESSTTFGKSNFLSFRVFHCT